MKFRNLKIGTRLLISLGVVVLLTVALAIASYGVLHKVGKQWESFHSISLQKTDALAEGNAMLASANENFKNFLLRGEAYRMSFMADLGGVEFAASTFATLSQQDAKESIALEQISAGAKKYLEGMEEAGKLKTGGATAADIDQAVKGFDIEIKSALDELTQLTRDETKAAGEAINDIVILGKRVIIVAAAVCIVIGVLVARLTSTSITRPLNEAVRIAQTVASGDLTANITLRSKDETGTLLLALKDMNDSLIRIVGSVRTGTLAMATASGQIAAGNMDLSSRTEAQASSLEETASSMEELTSTVRQNAENARRANGLATTASEVAIKGGAVISQVVDTMGSINASAKKIVDIIGVIDGIAFQTNILALNAAVEAARAGDQGRGFAVVASEVRSLAQRSALAAKEIKVLIADSVEKVENGNRLTDQAGITMQEVVDSIQRVTSIMGEIMSASDEQSIGIEQINQAIVQVDDITQQNAALVEEAASAAQSMQAQSRNLTDLVSVFKLDAIEKRTTADVAAPGKDKNGTRRTLMLESETIESGIGTASGKNNDRTPKLIAGLT